MDKSQIKLPAKEINIPFIGGPILMAREYDGLVFISGLGCQDPEDYRSLWTGAVGSEVTLEEGYESCKWCGLRHIDYIANAYGLDRVESVVRAFGLIAVADGFHDLDKVFDGYSDVMYTAFRERGRHVRTVMGTKNLPNKLTSEVEVIIKLRK